MNERFGITIDGVLVAHATVSPDSHELASLHVDPAYRRQGYGRRLMKLICDQADRHGVILTLIAAGGPEAMSTEQLEAWYTRFGFKFTHRAPWMQREPRILHKR